MRGRGRSSAQLAKVNTSDTALLGRDNEEGEFWTEAPIIFPPTS
jgi:hypothetical protein